MELRDKYKHGLYKFYGTLGGQEVKKYFKDFTPEEKALFLKEHSEKDINKFFKPVEDGQKKEKKATTKPPKPTNEQAE